MNPVCGACGSTEFEVLGDLGATLWLRCRRCGIDYKFGIKQEEPVEELTAFVSKVTIDLNIYAATKEDAERIANDVVGYVESNMYDYYVSIFEDEDNYDPEVEVVEINAGATFNPEEKE